MLINLRNALMAGKRTPYRCELEWLKSDGSAYLNLGILVPNNYWFKADVTIQSLDANGGTVLGSRNESGNQDFQLSIGNGTILERYGTFSQYYQYVPAVGDYSYEQATSGDFSINGNVVATLTKGTPSTITTLCVLALNSRGTISSIPTNIAIRHITIGDGANKVFELTPVLDNSGVVCFYDSISDKCLYNTGAGTFVGGPDKNA